jgi:hypothetical protein
MTKARKAMQPSTRVLATLLGLGLAVVGMSGAVQAQEPTSTDSPLGFGIRPAQASADDPTSFSYFTHYLEPGDELLNNALVINESDLPVRLQVYAAEAKTAINGGTAFGHRNENSNSVAGWITLDIREVSLQPGETQIVPFTISVPLDASPGDHVAGLLVERISTGNETDTGATGEEPPFAVEVVQRVGVAVVIDVPGDRVAQLGITDLRLGQQHDQGAVFEVAVHNTGNAMVNGHGTLNVTDPSGNELAEIPFDMDTVLAGDTTFFNIDHPVLLTDGEYLLHTRVEYRALRGDETIQTTALSNIELEVVNGQPKPLQDLAVPQSSTEVTLIGSGSEQENRARTIAIYTTLATLGLTGLAVVAWVRCPR